MFRGTIIQSISAIEVGSLTDLWRVIFTSGYCRLLRVDSGGIFRWQATEVSTLQAGARSLYPSVRVDNDFNFDAASPHADSPFLFRDD